MPYARSKLSELDDSDTISVVEGLFHPPRRRVWFLPGNCQQMWQSLLCLSVMEATGKNSVPLIFEQDRTASFWTPPQIRPEQLVWAFLPSCRSWRGQELPLTGLNNSTLFHELPGFPPVIKKPGTSPNYNRDNVECQTFGLNSSTNQHGRGLTVPGWISSSPAFIWCNTPLGRHTLIDFPAPWKIGDLSKRR